MRSRLAAALLAFGIFGLCAVAMADDDKRERERERERDGKKGGFKKGFPKKGDPKKADPKKADDPKADPKADEAKPADPDAKADAKAAKVSFKTDVAPLLNDACSNCHNNLKKKAGLDATNYDSIMKFVTAGAPDKSKLHNCLLGKGAKAMPPKNPLADEQVALIKNWIAAGAKKE